LIAFLAGAPIALAAFIAANILLITRRHQPQVVFSEIDWSLLVFFAALFVVSGSLETSGVTGQLVDLKYLAQHANIWNLTAITAVLSNMVSNVPAVLLLKPVVASMANPIAGWLTVAAASTLAGNLTLLGSVANLIVAETASRQRVDLSFWEYTKSGLIITLLSLVIDLAWLQLVL
jgi:Na+/H+ antiporter NhaD/arsenite permease-like protein